MRDGLMGAELQYHPAASVFPMMRGDEYQELLYDIQEHGLREPILLCDGQILDGRNRFRVCREIGIEPAFRKWDGKAGSPLSVVLSLNLHRRHLTSSQRAAIAVEILPLLEREAKERQRLSKGRGQKGTEKIPDLKGEARDQAAKMVGTNSKYISIAKQVHEADPALLQKVRDGETHIIEALSQVVPDKKRQLSTGKEVKPGEDAAKPNETNATLEWVQSIYDQDQANWPNVSRTFGVVFALEQVAEMIEKDGLSPAEFLDKAPQHSLRSLCQAVDRTSSWLIEFFEVINAQQEKPA